MGETETPKPPLVEITFDPAALAELIRAVAREHSAATAAAGPAVEPWKFYSPHAKCEVTAYLDDRQQLRHVPLSRTADVPKHWQRVYVEASE